MKSRQISFCGIMAALSTVIMMVAWFPYFTYAVPCTAALTIMVVIIEYNKRSALLTYLVSVVPIMLFCEGESKLLYVFFAGFYPILKALLEKIPSRVIEYILKLLSFNISALLIYLSSSFIFGVSYDDLGTLGEYGVVMFLILANITFLAFDFCISKMATFYIMRFHNSIAKILKK